MRRRMISPEFWVDSKIVVLSSDARLLYIGLWQYADDEGFFVEDLKNMKMLLFPDQKFPLEKSYQELTQCAFFRFGVLPDGRRVAQIRHFRDHQTINRPTPSKLREIVTFTDDSVTTHEDSLSTHSQVKLSKEKIGDSVNAHSQSHMESGDRTPDSSPFHSKKTKHGRAARTEPEDFTRWYEAYPRHEARADALKAWRKLNPDATLVGTIMTATDLYAKAKAETERSYIKLPASWLNGRRWEDDLAENKANGHHKPAEVKDLGNGIVEIDGRQMDRKMFERRYGTNAKSQ